MESIFVPDLKCNVERLKHNFTTKTMDIYLPENNHTDLTTTVDYAKKLDPDVLVIYAYVRNQLDVCYRKTIVGWEIVSVPSESNKLSDDLTRFKEMGCILVATCKCGCTEYMLNECPVHKKYLESLQPSEG
jgi:hypothetical protein